MIQAYFLPAPPEQERRDNFASGTTPPLHHGAPGGLLRLHHIELLGGKDLGNDVIHAERLIHTRAHGGPSVLLFEDLHWIDGASAAALER